MSIMSKYMTSSAVSVAALLSIRGLLMSPEAMFIKQRRLVTSKTPLQQLRLLNYEPRSISSLSPTLPMYVHSRCA
ncbi:hypothetical protein BDB01DRAFT_778234 [Pilobolus umbonatus]|nr:hypothetical protein BDB01DRAFT_778234 [Pilobolus umbonatus]